MHRLQPVADVGQRAADDHAHRVIEIAALHFVEDRDGLDVGWRRRGLAAGRWGRSMRGILTRISIARL